MAHGAAAPRMVNQDVAPGNLPEHAEPAGRARRAPQVDEYAALLQSSAVDARDAAYLKVLQSLLKPRASPRCEFEGYEDMTDPETVDDTGK